MHKYIGVYTSDEHINVFLALLIYIEVKVKI